MSADKIFVCILVLFFVGFVVYVAWNSRQNEKKNRAAETAGKESFSEAQPEVDAGEPSRPPKRRKRAPVA